MTGLRNDVAVTLMQLPEIIRRTFRDFCNSWMMDCCFRFGCSGSRLNQDGIDGVLVR